MTAGVVEVFKTNVQEHEEAQKLVALLREHFPETRINFDLDDCDKILRVEGRNFKVGIVIRLVNENGFHCALLE